MSSRPSHSYSDQRPADSDRVPWATVAVLVLLAANLALCTLRGGDRAALAFVALAHLNLLLLFWTTRRFDHAPPGSAARARARAAAWLLTASLTATFAWKMGELLPPPLAAATWVVAAAIVAGGGYFVLFVRDANK